MPYYNNKKIVFSAHYFPAIEYNKLPLKIAIDPASRGENVNFEVFGSTLDQNGEINAFESNEQSTEIWILNLLKNSVVLVKTSGGLIAFNSDLPILKSGDDFVCFDAMKMTDVPQRFYEIILAKLVEKTVTGALVTINDAAAGKAFVDVLAQINAIQDLHGYDYPWAAGNGKNKFRVTATSGTNNGVTYTVNADGTVTANNTATANSTYLLNTFTPEQGKEYYVNGGNATGAYIQLTYREHNPSGNPFFRGSTNVRNTSVTLGTGETGEWDYVEVLARVNSGTTVENSVVKPMIRLKTESNADFEPYENICPITGLTTATINHSGADTENPTQYNFTWGNNAGTIYGGTIDVTTGVLTVTHILVDLGAQTWSYNSTYDCFIANTSGATTMKSQSNLLCSIYPFKGDISQLSDYACAYYNTSIAIRDSGYNNDATAFKTAMDGVQMVYELETPTTYQLTPEEIIALSGTNNLWADTGNITVTYLSV